MMSLRRILVLGGMALTALYVVGLVPRLLLRQQLEADAATERERLPIVSVINPYRAPATLEVPLPGNIQAFLETGIFARTDGYLKERYVDIGDHVVQGQLLAEIETPEVDQQRNQALATLAESEANVVKLRADAALARTTLQRYVAAGPGTVSKQQIDERTAAVTDAEKAVDAAQATVNANKANVERLTDLQGFQRVEAPFDGIITQRNVDRGALISAGSNSGVTELFRLAQVNVLRVFVFVPQSSAPDIKVGQSADLTVRELPNRTFRGTVTRTAGAIDMTSRTMLTEVQVPNPEGLLLAGSYSTVQFKVSRAEPPLIIPSSALQIDAQGIRVGVIDGDGTLHYRAVQIGRDYGKEVEVLSGLDTTDLVATGVSGNLVDGSRVEQAKMEGGAPSPPAKATAPPRQ